MPGGERVAGAKGSPKYGTKRCVVPGDLYVAHQRIALTYFAPAVASSLTCSIAICVSFSSAAFSSSRVS